MLFTGSSINPTTTSPYFSPLKTLWHKSNRTHLGVGTCFKILKRYLPYLLVKAIFEAVEGGPCNLQSRDLVKLSVGAGDPMHSSRHQWKKQGRREGPYKLRIVNYEQCCGSVTFLVLIRIRGSVPLTYGSGSGSCSFRHWLSRANKKLVLLSRCPQPKIGFVVAYYFQNVFF